VLVFWLAIIFASFSLFTKLNPTVAIALVASRYRRGGYRE
jgi:hypothetical protein